MDKKPVDVLCFERDGRRTKSDEPVAESMDDRSLFLRRNMVNCCGGYRFSDGGGGVVRCLWGVIGGIGPAGDRCLGDG